MKKVIFIFSTIFIASCNKQDELLVQKSSVNNTEKIEVMKEFAQLLGRSLTDPYNREYVVGLINA